MKTILIKSTKDHIPQIFFILRSGKYYISTIAEEALSDLKFDNGLLRMDPIIIIERYYRIPELIENVRESNYYQFRILR